MASPKPFDPDFENLAVELQDLFATGKREQSGQPYRPHARFRNPQIWRAAAELCASVQADPFSFVRAAFLYCSIPGGPFPQNMATKAAVRWYEEYQKLQVKGQGGDPFAAEVSSLIRHALRQLPHRRFHATVSDFLLDDMFTRLDVIPAFIRLIILPHDTRLRTKFGLLAKQEVLGNPRLLELLQQQKWDLSFLS
jgi:hypothetical protein